MTYNEMKAAVIKATNENDKVELEHMEWLDGRWYEDILDELAEAKRQDNATEVISKWTEWARLKAKYMKREDRV